MLRSSRWPRASLFIVLTIGVAVVWGFAVGACMSLWNEFTATNRPMAYESLFVTAEGQPLIHSYSYIPGTGTSMQTYRTLAGKAVDLKLPIGLSAANLSARAKPPKAFDGPTNWRARLAWGSDAKPPLTTWYLVRDVTDRGFSYFVGYDSATKLRVGYLGRDGFRSTTPKTDDQFELGPGRNYGTSSRVAGLVAIRGYSYRRDSDSSAVKPWCAYLLDGEQLLEVDFRSRSVRTLLESPDMISIGIASVASEEQNAEGNLLSMLVVRLANRLLALNPTTGDQKEFKLPEQLSSTKGRLHVYVVDDDHLLAHATESRRLAEPIEWLKLDAAGAVIETFTADLASYQQPSEVAQALEVVFFVPAPAVMAAGVFVLLPLSDLESASTATYAEAVASTANEIWPAIAVACVIGAIAALCVWRWQHKYRRRFTPAWCIAVFILGVPGLIAYWLHHRRPPLESCDACRETVPRDRHDCAACGEEFTAPRLLGTEVFA